VSAAPSTLRRRPLPGAGTVAAAALRVVRIVPLRVRLGVVVAIALLAGGWLWLRDSPLVAVRHVTVIGAHGADAKAIRAAIEDAAFDQTTLHLDPPALERAVSSYPLVKSLEVHAHPPHGLTVVVESEKPVAWVAGGGQRVAVNATGKLLRGAFSTLALPTVPVSLEPAGGHVTDQAALEALDAIAEAPAALAARVSRVRVVPGFGLVATLRRGPELRLGDTTRLAAKWDAAARVLADASSHGASYIDVRVPERPAAGGVAAGSQVPAVVPVTPVAPTVTPAVTTPAPAVAAPATTTPSVTTTPALSTPATTTPVASAGGAQAAGATPAVNP
jgi:cell division protein FtsQ